MAASSTPPAKIADGRRLTLIALALLLVVALPAGVAVGLSWVDLPWSSERPSTPTPEWVPMPQVRATTSDGTVVKARVSLDVPSTTMKSAIQRNIQQVGLLLEVSIASQTREQIGSSDGITRLSEDMRQRLNDYLGADGDDAVRSVAIQDLLVKPQ